MSDPVGDRDRLFCQPADGEVAHAVAVHVRGHDGLAHAGVRDGARERLEARARRPRVDLDVARVHRVLAGCRVAVRRADGHVVDSVGVPVEPARHGMAELLALEVAVEREEVREVLARDDPRHARAQAALIGVGRADDDVPPPVLIDVPRDRQRPAEVIVALVAGLGLEHRAVGPGEELDRAVVGLAAGVVVGRADDHVVVAVLVDVEAAEQGMPDLVAGFRPAALDDRALAERGRRQEQQEG